MYWCSWAIRRLLLASSRKVLEGHKYVKRHTICWTSMKWDILLYLPAYRMPSHLVQHPYFYFINLAYFWPCKKIWHIDINRNVSIILYSHITTHFLIWVTSAFTWTKFSHSASGGSTFVWNGGANFTILYGVRTKNNIILPTHTVQTWKLI